ncbi:hypothetical protein KPSA3_01097 [Pseudomonas syringae pv. actinidiae]|uniref:Uncharacterized protein n=1 Tax=Pseudomonas syringae pv. actinidiae TaxID=103796 RepID=A0AAN4Q193_PSESF|nr:hypothetical protein KPSA3_01097 [Pseudomonas syringae pv. actinidiae]
MHSDAGACGTIITTIVRRSASACRSGRSASGLEYGGTPQICDAERPPRHFHWGIRNDQSHLKTVQWCSPTACGRN